MARRTETSQKRQSRRVAAWIYAVINPIIDSLNREISLLDAGNLTWRVYSRHCEMIKKIQEYVDSTQWPNYQDFLAEHPQSVFVPGFKQHDSDVDSLNNVAQVLFDRLLSWPAFLDSVQAALTSYDNQRASLGPRARSLEDLGKKDVYDEVAQHVINNAQALPSHYIISHFWNEVGSDLLSFRNRPEFQPLHRSRGSLLEHSARLKQAMESYRLTLSRDYDVPAAPVPGLTFETR